MAIKNRKVEFPTYPVYPELKLQGRIADKQAKPRHLITQIDLHPELLVSVHTAGRDKLWSLPITAAATNRRLILGLSSEDALTLGAWYGQAEQKKT